MENYLFETKPKNHRKRSDKLYNERINSNLIKMDEFNEDEFKMDINASETLKDAFNLGHIKDKGYITDKDIDRLQKLIDAEKQTDNVWEKSMARHYQLELIVVILFNMLDDLMDRIDELEETK